MKNLEKLIKTKKQKQSGFSLVELMVAIGISAILLGAVFLLANPGKLFAGARNSQRTSHVSAIVNAIRQNIADNRSGTFSCAAGELPTSSKRMATGAGNYNIAPCLVPTYIQNLPFDPSTSTAHWTNVTDYDTGYYVARNTSTLGVYDVTVSAPAAELGKTVSVTR